MRDSCPAIAYDSLVFTRHVIGYDPSAGILHVKTACVPFQAVKEHDGVPVSSALRMLPTVAVHATVTFAPHAAIVLGADGVIVIAVTPTAHASSPWSVLPSFSGTSPFVKPS